MSVISVLLVISTLPVAWVFLLRRFWPLPGLVASSMAPEVLLAERSAPGVEAVVEIATKKDSIGADMSVEADIGKTLGKTLGKK